MLFLRNGITSVGAEARKRAIPQCTCRRDQGYDVGVVFDPVESSGRAFRKVGER